VIEVQSAQIVGGDLLAQILHLEASRNAITTETAMNAKMRSDLFDDIRRLYKRAVREAGRVK